MHHFSEKIQETLYLTFCLHICCLKNKHCCYKVRNVGTFFLWLKKSLASFKAQEYLKYLRTISLHLSKEDRALASGLWGRVKA